MSKPIIACSSGIGVSSEQIEAIAAIANADFLWSNDIGFMLKECDLRSFSCVMVDFDTASQLPDVMRPSPFHRVMIYAVPKGSIRAAFRTAAWGAINVLEKSVPIEEATRNVKAAFESERRLQNLADQKHDVSQMVFAELSQRERQVLLLSMSGEPNKRVAGILDVGLRTVEGDRSNLMKKLKVDSFAKLIKLAVERQQDAYGLRRRLFHEALLKTSQYSRQRELV